MPDGIILRDQDRAKLDNIVSQMTANKESEEDIMLLVNDFKSKYGQKKNASSVGSTSSSQNLKTGGISDQPFLTSTNKSLAPTILTPEKQAEFITENKNYKQPEPKNLKLSGLNFKRLSPKSMQEAEMLMATPEYKQRQAEIKEQQNFENAEEQKVIDDRIEKYKNKYGDGFWGGVQAGIEDTGRIIGRAGARGSLKIGRGLLEAGDILRTTIGGEEKMSTEQQQAYNEVFDKAKGNTTAGLPEKYHGSNTLQRAVGGLAEFMPAALASTSTAGTSFFFNGIGSAAEEVEEIKKLDPNAFNNGSEDLYKVGRGAVEYFLMNRLNSHTMFAKLPSSVRNNISGKISIEAIKDVAKSGEKLTSESILNAMKNKTVSFATKFKELPLKTLKKYRDTSIDLSALSASAEALKIASNEVSGKEDFEISADRLLESIGTILSEDAIAFAGLGMRAEVGALFNKSPYKNIVVESLKENPSPENVEIIKQEIETMGSKEAWPEADIINSVSHVEKIAESVKVLPKNFNDIKFDKAIDLVTGRKQLESELAEIKTSKEIVDESIRDIPTEQESALQSKIEQSNDKLRELATDKKYKYEFNEENGTYTKQLGKEGKLEEITAERYELEQVEKPIEVKIKSSDIQKPIDDSRASESDNIRSEEVQGTKRESDSNKPVRSLEEIEADQKAMLVKYHDALNAEGLYDQAKESKVPAEVIERIKQQVEKEYGKSIAELKAEKEMVLSDNTNTIQADTYDRKSKFTKERVQYIRRQPTTSPKKLNVIIADFANKISANIIYGKSGGKGTLGTYNSSNELIKIKNAGDLDVVAHEMGHLIDDRHKVLNTTSPAVDAEIKWFFDRGGSNPPKKMPAQMKQQYLKREGLAEFIRATIVNPEQTKIIAPELTKHFESQVDAETMKALKEFSEDYLTFANSNAGEQILSNIQDGKKDSKGEIAKWLKSWSRSKDSFKVTFGDQMKAQLANSLHVSEMAFKFANKLGGRTDLLPEQNFELLSRVFAGVNGKVDRLFENGLVDGKNIKLTDNGKNLTVNWLLETLDPTSQTTIKRESEEVIKLIVAERTVEYANKFKRQDKLTGIGGGVRSDVEVAVEFLTEFNDLVKTDKAKYDRLKEAARRYRVYADAGLRYAVDKGRLSESQYEAIKASNQYYVNLTRVNEVSPTQEPLAFSNKFAKGGLTTVKDVFKKSEGGTGTIQNPYESLLKQTVDMIVETDRNEVLKQFIEPLKVNRSIGQGQPVPLAQIGREVSLTETKNSKTVYIDGKPHRWQFNEDVYKSLTGMEGLANNAFMSVISLPAKLLRFTVTHSPTFAVRNIVRDAQSRFVLSRSGSGVKEFIHDATDRELFDLFGGSQGGHHLTSREAYYDQMSKSVKELSRDKGILLDPRKLANGWGNYKSFLEKGENVNRIAEFKSAYKKAKSEGLDEYNAGIQAAYEARDLLDFAVSGHTMRVVNQIIPFSNAAIQGLRRSIKGATENPAKFASNIALLTIMPTILVRGLNIANGDEEEYEQLPGWQRDLFWNFRTPTTGSTWIMIPKAYDLGVFSSATDRLISKFRGNDKAFNGFHQSLINVIMPFDEGTLLGPFKAEVEVALNKDIFRDGTIIPVWEENKLLQDRAGTKYASNAGKMISQAFGFANVDVDPRYIDHYIKAHTSYFGDWALSASDIGRKDTRFKFGWSKTGFAKEPPVSNAQAVLDTYDLAKKLGREQSKPVKAIKELIKSYYEEEDASKKKALISKIYNEAIAEREHLEGILKKKKALRGEEPLSDELSDLQDIEHDNVVYELTKVQVKERKQFYDEYLQLYGDDDREDALISATQDGKDEREAKKIADKAVESNAKKYSKSEMLNKYEDAQGYKLNIKD